ncbi:MAG: CbiX/SirB N-terminal domain-containing protein [Bacillota bacterium]
MAEQGVIILAHGSRLAEANGEVLKLAGLLAEKEGVGVFCGVAFLQGGSPALYEALDQAAAAGCTTIYIVPFFLTSGVHIREDLPLMLKHAGQAHPGLELVQCRPLGCDPRLTSLLWERVREKCPRIPAQTGVEQ